MQKYRQRQLGSRLPNNKLYDTRKVKPVLEAHGEDDYSTLLANASKEVKHLWRRRLVLERIDYDPVWYGMPEYADTMQDVENWEQQYGWRTR